MTDKADRSRDEDATEFLSHLRPEELERLAKVSRLNDRQFARLEEVTELSEEEWVLLTEGVSLVRSLQVVGKVTRWFVIGLVGVFLGVVALGDAWIKFKALFSGVPR
ncbi:hypothetical protein ACLBXM_04960 [Xanthobacteraceae bacterium A53D]